MIERFFEVFELISLNENYKLKHFHTFLNIKRWANFIKHPKAFMFTHHSEFDYENSGHTHKSDFELTIDDNFINEYYKGSDKNNALYKKLKNKQNILVMFPDPIQLTEKFCIAYSKFISVLLKNEVYKEILNDQTTIDTHFENEESNS